MELSINEQKPSIKLMKMSKGYQWEIKDYGNLDEKLVEKITKIDTSLRAKFGEGNGNDTNGNGSPASEKQLKYLEVLKGKGLIKDFPKDISKKEASELISQHA